MVCAVLPASCGGDRLSKAEFIEQADEICSEAQDQAQDLPPPTDPASVERYANSLEEVTNDYIGRLRELEPPAEDAERIDRLIDDIESAGLKIVEASRTSSEGENPAEAYAEALHLAEGANEQAEGYGFSSCGISEGLAPH